MRCNVSLITIALASMLSASSGVAASFGTAVPIGGHASDIVLDEARGVLYIANFTANRIEVMDTTDQTISRSINVNPQPGSMALSPNGRYLVIGHYDNAAAPLSSSAIVQSNAITVLDLDAGTKQSYALGNVPLGVAFGADGLALILTTSLDGTGGEFFLFDPATGTLRLLQTITGVIAKSLP